MANPFLARFEDSPALVHPDKHRRFEASLIKLNDYMDAQHQRELAASNGNDDFWFADNDWRSVLRPYVVVNGVLQIPVKGVLLHDFGYQYFDWATGYVYIEKAIERGMGDGNVKGIALVIDSPGGEVAGNFDLVDKIFAWRGTKPIRAYASESAYSAAYSIASAADSITVSRTGGVGSIGVVTAHVDVSKMMDDWGYKVTFIYAGAHKVDGNPYEALKPEVKERIQARIDELYSIFVQTVARNREMDEQAVRDTEALTFTASEATQNGLADNIGERDASIAAFAVELSLNDGDDQMANVNENKDNAATVTLADFEKGKAEAHAAGVVVGKAEGKAEGLKEGASAAVTRINAILDSEEGKKRPKAALSAALKTSMTVEEATAFLADLAEEKASAPIKDEKDSKGKPNATRDAFSARMDADGNPDVGEPGEEDAEATAKNERVNRTLAAFPKPKHKAVA